MQDPFKGPDGFKRFLWMVWKKLNLPPPTDVQYDIADYLQHGPKRSVIQAFRGVGKSWETSAFAVWVLYCDPQKKIQVVSASKDRADAFSTFTKRLINEIELLHFLRPQPGQRDSVISFDVGPARPDHSPSIKSVGITGQLTGSRADIIIADDIEVANNSATQMMRDKLSEAVKEFDAILKPLPSSRIIYLGTPQSEMSIYNLLPARGYEIRVWPAEYPTPTQREGYQGRLAKIITEALDRGLVEPRQPTDPKRFDANDLAERRLSYGKAGYALQFMLDTSLSDLDRYPLKVEDLIVANLDIDEGSRKYVWGPTPEAEVLDVTYASLTGDRLYWPMKVDKETEPYSGCVMAIDPSGRGADETSYAIVKHLHGQLFVVSVGGIKGGYDIDTLKRLARLAEKYSAKKIVVESNFGDGMFTQLLKPVLGEIYPCTIEEVRHNTQKEKRIIDTLEPVLGSHRLIVDKKVFVDDWDTAEKPERSLFYQMTRLTAERGALAHDDRLDALAMAVAYWNEAMARNVEKSVQKAREKAMEKVLKDFVKDAKRSALGGSKQHPKALKKRLTMGRKKMKYSK